MKYFLKKLGATVLYGIFGGGLLLSGLHILEDYVNNMNRIENEENEEKRKLKEETKQ